MTWDKWQFVFWISGLVGLGAIYFAVGATIGIYILYKLIIFIKSRLRKYKHDK